MTPEFTHEELKEAWNALAQYVENHEEPEDVPEAARSALEKLDQYMSGPGKAFWTQLLGKV